MTKKNKKIVFDDTDIRHAKLKIRLQHDNLSQAEFFRAMITGYIENDTILLKYIRKYKEDNKIQSKSNSKKAYDEIKSGQQKMKSFGIADTELEDLFDLIAKEYPDL